MARSRANCPGEVEQVILLFAGGRQARKILLCDHDVARRAGHLPFARPFERLAFGLGEIEQIGACRCIDLMVERAISLQKPNLDHAGS